MADLVPVAIALGSNVGDRAAHLEHAVARLRGVLDGVRVSSFHETIPVAMRGPQGLFLNAALVGSSSGTPRDLLNLLLAIELERGRARPRANAARTLDLDLILFGAVQIDEPGLVVPHLRFRTRRFVLGPLVEIAPDMVDPLSGLSVAELVAAL
ncbi:MAG: 2-amino-4-hydroxy-6-hydroxymethyldihydropteridine diphosphokinase [Acidobacteriota bacterium]